VDSIKKAKAAIKLGKRINIEGLTIFTALSIVVILLFLALFGDLIVPHDPTECVLQARLLPPFWLKGGSMKYALGTDPVGRDLLSRTIVGAKYSLGVSIVAVILSALIGVTVGMVSGFVGGIVDAIIMRFADLAIAFPMIILGLLMGITLGPSVPTLITVLVIVQWARFARQVRGEVLSIKETDFVAQARVAGCSTARMILRHIFPNVTNTLLVLMTLQVGWSIIVESSLSFLGAGIPPPTPGWGLMVAYGRDYLISAWWVSLVPGTAIMITILAFNTIGDWVRDRLDPRLRQL